MTKDEFIAAPCCDLSMDSTVRLCTVRDVVGFMFEQKSDVCEMVYEHEGKKWNVELRILRVEDKEGS